jgi:hypothetical protein
MSGASPDVDAPDPVGTFEAVVEAVEEWPAGVDHATPRRVRDHLDATLNDEDESVWEREIVERRDRAADADVTVNGTIAVTLVDHVSPSTAPDLSRSISALGDQYGFVVVLWTAPTAADRGYRRSVERSLSDTRVGARGLAFVDLGRGSTPAPSAGGPGLPVVRGLAVALVAVTAAAASGAVFLRTAGTPRALLLGVAGLFVVVLALAGFVVR